MSKFQWSEVNSFLDWLQKYQQQIGDIFKTKDFRAAFNLGNLDSQSRLNRLSQMGFIKHESYGHYRILEISPQKIQEVKNQYISPGAVEELHNFGGQQLTLKEIHAKFRSPVSLAQFSQRIARGWSIKRAISQPPIKRRKD